MTHNKYLLLATIAILSVASVSCSKDDDEAEKVANNAGQPVAIGGTVGEIVDLGLSVKWASQNLGAASKEDLGKYFVFGETEPKTNYTWATDKWGEADALTKYQLSSVDLLKQESSPALPVLRPPFETFSWLLPSSHFAPCT